MRWNRIGSDRVISLSATDPANIFAALPEAPRVVFSHSEDMLSTRVQNSTQIISNDCLHTFERLNVIVANRLSVTKTVVSTSVAADSVVFAVTSATRVVRGARSGDYGSMRI